MLSSVGAESLIKKGRTRPFKQFLCINTGRFRSNLRGNFPLGESFSLAQSRIGESEPHMVIRDSKILRSFGYAIWREIFRLLVVAPLAAQHERRTHDCAAATV